jgi:hypothetical protein
VHAEHAIREAELRSALEERASQVMPTPTLSASGPFQFVYLASAMPQQHATKLNMTPANIT